MIRITDNASVRTCKGVRRREFLRIGSLALGGLSLSNLLHASEAGRSFVKDKAVVLLFLQGGPTQIETFDPKPNAPVEIRSLTGAIQTKLPGVQFGGTFPKLAAMADKLAIVHSFASGNADHQDYMTVGGGGNPTKAPMGSLYARIAGPNAVPSGMPNNVILPAEAVKPGLRLPTNFETDSLRKFIAASHNLGANYAFFDPSGGGELRQNLELRLPAQRLTDRRGLLDRLDTFRRQADRTGVFENASAYDQQAYDLLLRGVSQAFDLSREDPRVVGRYDTSGIFDMTAVQRWGDMHRTSNLLGKQMLLARRLVEHGCGFVTVMDAGWDMHANENSPRNLYGLNWLGNQVDHAVSVFLADVEARGLSDKILLIVTGEMGRSPRISNNGGRDHWGNLTPLLIAGGGLKMGQVVGQSDRQAGNPASERYTPRHLLCTVMETLFNTAEVRLQSELPRDVASSASAGTVIRELF
ncbi:MAG TPA: DUF1501 domain-containing protein [Gemmataceae bacterium]|jgi:hypothetical protein|nr:DUF1501 domain-containing protein [Gemmataceae bacterium]